MAVRPHSSPCLPASAPCPTGTPHPAPRPPLSSRPWGRTLRHSDTRVGLAEKGKAEGASERGSNVWTAGHLQAMCAARAGFLPRVNWNGHSREMQQHLPPTS